MHAWRRLWLLISIALLVACGAPARDAAPLPQSEAISATAPDRPAGPPANLESSAPVDLYARNAPEFPAGLEWLNVSRPLTMAELRGKVVIIDFWTYGCINCIHNVPDLKRLQAEHPDEAVVIGVHSAKFTTEAETASLRQMLARYRIDYPVINDRAMLVWNLWNARAWPTTVVVDASGVLAAIHVGEGAYAVLKPTVLTLIREAEAQSRLDRTSLPAMRERAQMPITPLAYPAGALADPRGDRLFIADTGHHRIIIVDPRNGDLLDLIGSGREAFADGDFSGAAFASPHGMALSTDGTTLYVADTGNHAIRSVDLRVRQVSTLIGTGQRARAYPPKPGIAPDVALSSPWDVALDGAHLFIAMAGAHQVWRYRFADGFVGPLAGSGVEGAVDGVAGQAQLAQPSGLALDDEGRLYVADAESSSVRVITPGDPPMVATLAGGGSDLFTFGDQDGAGRAARLQHPQGVAFFGGSVYVVDTYNHKIKRIDPDSGEVRTIAGGERGWADGVAPQFDEPGALAAGADRLYIADTNNHSIRVLNLANGETTTLALRDIERLRAPLRIEQQTPAITLPLATVAPGEGKVELDIQLPAGYKINDLAPSSVRWNTDGGIILPVDADRSLAGMGFPLELPATFTGDGALTADMTLIYCEATAPKVCLIEEVRLIAPFVVVDSGATRLSLRHTIAFRS